MSAAPQSQEQWFEKIKTWVPGWFFESEKYNVAIFQALAKVLASADAEMRAQVDETFITRASGYTLDAHGYERGVIRYVGEEDEDYAERIRNLANVLTPDSVEILTNTFLLIGVCNVVEHSIEGLFCDRESFFNRQENFSDIHYNTFSVVIRNQGVSDAADTALQIIAKTLNSAKALGTLYRIVESKY